MKILKGRLRETIYGWPCQQSNNTTPCRASKAALHPGTQHSCSASAEHGPASLQIIRSTVYKPEQVTYMSDGLGLHRVENASDSEVAVSLHLYTVSCSHCESFSELMVANAFVASERGQARLPHL